MATELTLRLRIEREPDELSVEDFIDALYSVGAPMVSDIEMVEIDEV